MTKIKCALQDLAILFLVFSFVHSRPLLIEWVVVWCLPCFLAIKGDCLIPFCYLGYGIIFGLFSAFVSLGFYGFTMVEIYEEGCFMSIAS